jgi:hypothetical protein
VALPSLGQLSRLAPREHLRHALEDVLDRLLQRAPVEARPFLQPLDGLLTTAPREDRAHPVLLYTRSVNTPGITLVGAKMVAMWLPFGAHLRPA